MVFDKIKNCKALVVLKTKNLVLVPIETPPDLNKKFGPRQKLMTSRPRKEPVLIYCAEHFSCQDTVRYGSSKDHTCPQHHVLAIT